MYMYMYMYMYGASSNRYAISDATLDLAVRIIVHRHTLSLCEYSCIFVENKSLISTPRKLISTTGKLIFQVREYT